MLYEEMTKEIIIVTLSDAEPFFAYTKASSMYIQPSKPIYLMHILILFFNFQLAFF
jgi:hypothetical protein